MSWELVGANKERREWDKACSMSSKPRRGFSLSPFRCVVFYVSFRFRCFEAKTRIGILLVFFLFSLHSFSLLKKITRNSNVVRCFINRSFNVFNSIRFRSIFSCFIRRVKSVLVKLQIVTARNHACVCWESVPRSRSSSPKLWSA